MSQGEEMKIQKSLKLRFREELRVQIEEAARVNGTSMNAEIIDRLQRSFTEADILKRIDQAVTRSITKATGVRL